MMPVVAGDRETRRQIWLYSLVMAPVAMAPLLTDIGGPIYAVVAGVATCRFVQLAWGLYHRDAEAAAADHFRAEKKFFGYSIIYLFTVFSALMAEAVWRGVTAGSV